VRLPQPALLVITDRRQARRPLEDVAAAAFAGGCRWLSLREKDLPASERRRLLGRLVALGARWDAVVGVHEDVAAARQAGAGAVHLPDGAAPAPVRAALGQAVLIGVSAHDAAGIARAAAAGADYVTLSPIFASASKPGYGPALGLEALARAARGAAIPVIALGGVDEATIARCIEAGAAGAAVMGAVMAADAAAAATAALVAALAAGNLAGHSPPLGSTG
jgi:thiamine-phosphate pyrophosphorylase